MKLGIIIFMGVFLFAEVPMRKIPLIKIPNVFASSHKMHLEMIFNQQAKINQHWYQEGDELFGLKIKKIELGKVVLVDSNSEQIILEF